MIVLIKVRSYFVGESCLMVINLYMLFDTTKWKGLNPGIICFVGLEQCQKGYLYRESIDCNGDNIWHTIYQKPLDNDAKYRRFSSSSFDPSENVSN